MDSKLINIGMELNVLAAIFKYQEKFFTEMPTFQARYLANPTHRIIYSKLVELREQGKPIPSLKTFRDYIVTEPTLAQQDINIIPKVLDEVPNHVPKLNDLELITKTITNLYLGRKLLSKTNDMVDNIANSNISDIYVDLKKHIMEGEDILSSDKPIDMMQYKADLDKRIDYVKMIATNPEANGLIQTGLKNFDKFFPRQSPGQLVIFQARTNVGKSMFLKNTAVVNYKAGLNVLVVTIEMNSMEWSLRIDSELSELKHNLFTSGKIVNSTKSLDRWRDSVNSFGSFKNKGNDLNIYWQPSGCTPAKLDSIIARNSFKPDLIVVDYAGDMKCGLKGVGDYDPRAHAEIYSALKELAGKYKCVIYTAQQTKRGVKKVSDESGAWSDVASGKADLMIAVEKNKEDELFEIEINGVRYSERLTVTAVKGRHIPKNCYTKIIPSWDKMCWIEAEFDAPKFEGRIDNEKTAKQITKDAIEDTETSISGIPETQETKNKNEEINVDLDTLM